MRAQRGLAGIWAGALGAILLLAASGSKGQGPSPASSSNPAHLPRNKAEFDQMFKEVSNWGRWGKDDQRGAANLVTAAKRKQAAALVKSGITVSLEQTPITEETVDNRSSTPPYPQWQDTHPMPGYDKLTIGFHGYVHSHLDALCHFSYDGKTFNGYNVGEVYGSQKECVKLGIDKQKNGVFTRGVLIDMPRLKGVPYLEPGVSIYAEDIEAWEKKAGVKVGVGDAILLRTGRWVRRAQLGPRDPAEGMPGYHASLIRWFRQRDVAYIGSDALQDTLPSPVDGVPTPLHTGVIVALGVQLFDSLNLDELAETAARLNRWEFLLTVGPLATVGGSGSPVNPQASF